MKKNNMKKLITDSITSTVNKYPTRSDYGFNPREIVTLLTEYDINIDKFYDALGVNTCMIEEGQVITYHCDVAKALRCVIEDRQQTLEEWD